MVILYLPDSGSFTNKISTLLISSFGFIFSFAIGQFFSFSHTASIIAFGVYTLLIHLILLQYKTAPPSFFFIFITVLSICQPFNFDKIPERIGLISLGLLFANFLILMHLLYLSTKTNWDLEPQPTRIFQKTDYANFWEAITLGCFMSASLWCGYYLEMENPYWIPISCAAVMQGASRYHIWQRTFQRILGTLLGLALCWLILSISNSIVVLCILIIPLQLIIEMLITRNYAVAVIFITPLAIFLSEAANPLISDPNVLIVLRLKETIIGSIIGAFGGWLLHKEKVRYASIKGLEKIGKKLEN